MCAVYKCVLCIWVLHMQVCICADCTYEYFVYVFSRRVCVYTCCLHMHACVLYLCCMCEFLPLCICMCVEGVCVYVYVSSVCICTVCMCALCVFAVCICMYVWCTNMYARAFICKNPYAVSFKKIEFVKKESWINVKSGTLCVLLNKNHKNISHKNYGLSIFQTNNLYQ